MDLRPHEEAADLTQLAIAQPLGLRVFNRTGGALRRIGVPLVDLSPAALFDRINIVLAAGQLGSTTRSTIVNAVSTIDAASDSGKARRVQATILLVMTAPEYLVLK